MSLRIRLIVAAGLLAMAGMRAPGAAPEDISLTISPAKPAVPALGHRLLPLESELNPGNAAPIYMRLGLALAPEARQQLEEKPFAWLQLPLDQFPAGEARKFIDEWGGQIALMEFAARRRSCEWDYPLAEQREQANNILLPDAQMMRVWGRLLAAKARVEVAEHKADEAIRTTEIGIAFGRHVGDGPFLINNLIGMAMIRVMLNPIDELISEPGAPSLYWSLTALPRPLIPIREALANEYKLCEWLLPEMTDLDRERTDAEWEARLARLHGRLVQLKASYQPEKIDPKVDTLAGFRELALPEARKYALERKGKVDGICDDRMILIYLGGKYRDLYDEVYKASHLPFPEALPFYRRGDEQLHAVKSGPLWLFASLISAVESGHRAEAMLDRRIAALRVVEALRLHAGAEGRLPGSLDEVKAVPIPINPVTGRPFAYRLDGDAAILEEEQKPDGPGPLGLRYRITLRGGGPPAPAPDQE
jgi:hypothetical protein